MKYKDYEINQLMLLPPTFEDLIPEESIIWAIIDVVNEDMVKGFETSKSEEGNAAYHPLMMTRLLVWAYANGLHSSRQIERRTYTDIELIFMCSKQHPNFRTICNFRKNHAQFLSTLYKKLYRAAYKFGLTKMLYLSVDGAHFAANASGKKGCKRISRWKEIEKELDGKIAEYEKTSREVDAGEDKELGLDQGIGLPKEYQDAKKRRKKIKEVLQELEDEDPKKKVNLTDPHARFLVKKGGKKTSFGYNVGVTSDENQLIPDISMTSVSSDQAGLKAGIEGTEETIGKDIPEGTKGLADAGYYSAKNIEYLEKKGMDGYIAPSMDFKTDEFEKEWKEREFKYDEKRDVVICKYGRELVRHHPKKKPKKDIVQYRARKHCTDCPYKDECCKRGKRKFLDFMRGIDKRTMMTEKMLKDESKEIYVKRKTTVEPVIGDIKFNMKLSRLSVRGFAGKVDVCLAALWHNIKIIIKMPGAQGKKWVYA